MSDKKLELEKRVLELSLPLLKKIYGEIEIDPQQTDRPDAAIRVVRPRKQASKSGEAFLVGIEITTVDPSDSLAYFNDAKHGKDIAKTQRENALEHGDCETDQPLKKMTIETPATLIYSAAIKKKDKYSSYAAANKFREIILVCFSENIRVSEGSFKAMLEQTDSKLKEAGFLYDRVLFLGLRDGCAQKVYDRHGTIAQVRAREGFDSVTRISTGFRLIGKKYNLYKTFESDPLIQPRERK